MTDQRLHLRSTDELSLEDLVDVLDLTDHMVEVCRRPVPKVPALRGRTVLSLFFEDSTRTRLSFETAAKRLSADTMTFSASSSSVNKGESLRDTVETLDAMGIDAVVVRHRSAGVRIDESNDLAASPASPCFAATARSRCLCMFSIITIAASIIAPTAIAMPPSDMMSAPTPTPRMAMKAMRIPRGSVTMATRAELACNRNTMQTIATMIDSSTSLPLSVSIARSIRSLRS